MPMTGVYPKLSTYFWTIFSFAGDLWAHPQPPRWLAGQQTTSRGNRNGIIYTRAVQPPFADPLGGPARSLNINEIVYMKTCRILLMLHFRGVINVGQFSVLAIVKI